MAVTLAASYGHVRLFLLAAWALALVASVLLRLDLTLRYEKAPPHSTDFALWQWRTMLALATSGTVWGIYAWLAPPAHGRLFEPIAAFIAVTVTGTSLVLITAHRRYYLSFSLPIFLLLAARLLLVPPRSPLLAFAAVVVFAVLIRAADRARRILGTMALRGEHNAYLIRAFRRQSDLLVRERDRLHHLFESVPAPVAYCDECLVLRRHNRSFRETFVRPGHPLVGRPLPEILGRRRFRTFEAHCAAALSGEPCVFETELPSLGADGRKRRTFRISFAPDREGDEGVGIFLHLVDITAYKKTEARLTAAALRDPLTQLYNRRGFEAILNGILARDSELVHSILYLDLDHLKEINDRFGHDTGDAALRTFAERLRRSIRTNDHCARLGGDEFAVLLRDCTPDCAERVAASIRQATDKPFAHGGAIVSLEASIGGVSFLPHTTSGQDAIAAADRCMYAAKRERRLVLRSLP